MMRGRHFVTLVMWKVVLELIFGTAMVNAWIIFNMGKEKGMPKKEFTEAIIESFTGKPISAGTRHLKC
ncbi:hypothetical protein evm_013374 [Chilo suppressalis]|nr:hypothetical protein evm_013374 [Chilo suppressalis]